MTDDVDKVFDPFLGREVEISARLTDRLRGRYAIGPMLPNGEPEFGWREFGPTPPIQHEAAAEIERLTRELAEADRRAGEAERYLERLKVEQSKERNWIWEAKAARGYDQNVSFDRVWAETCAKAERAEAAESERDALRMAEHKLSAAYLRLRALIPAKCCRPPRQASHTIVAAEKDSNLQGNFAGSSLSPETP